jgi:tRNA-dihydrouridine synthase B
MIKLGRLELKNPYLFAPMSMFSDVGFRLVCESYGASYSFTEQLYASEFIAKTDRMKRKLDLHSPCGIQFLSNSPEELKTAIEIIKNHEFYQGLHHIKSIDLNLACPMKKTREQNLGSELLKQAPLVEKLFLTMKKNSHLPVSAKLRLGVNAAHMKSKPYLRIAKLAESSGLDFITIHGRTSAQLYEGKSDIEPLKEVAKETKIALIGNGDVTDVASANKLLEFCDAIMIGRHAVKEPFIFSQLQGKTFDVETEKFKAIKQYLNYSDKFNIGFQLMKVHVQSLLKNTSYTQEMMDLTHTKTKNDILQIVNRILKS